MPVSSSIVKSKSCFFVEIQYIDVSFYMKFLYNVSKIWGNQSQIGRIMDKFAIKQLVNKN